MPDTTAPRVGWDQLLTVTARRGDVAAATLALGHANNLNDEAEAFRQSLNSALASPAQENANEELTMIALALKNQGIEQVTPERGVELLIERLYAQRGEVERLRERLNEKIKELREEAKEADEHQRRCIEAAFGKDAFVPATPEGELLRESADDLAGLLDPAPSDSQGDQERCGGNGWIDTGFQVKKCPGCSDPACPNRNPAPTQVEGDDREPNADEWQCDSCGLIAPAEAEGWEQTPQDDAGVSVERCPACCLHPEQPEGRDEEDWPALEIVRPRRGVDFRRGPLVAEEFRTYPEEEWERRRYVPATSQGSASASPQTIESLARQIHETWVRVTKAQGLEAETTPWEQLPEMFRQGSYAVVRELIGEGVVEAAELKGGSSGKP